MKMKATETNLLIIISTMSLLYFFKLRTDKVRSVRVKLIKIT